jgi:hypothetical protein
MERKMRRTLTGLAAGGVLAGALAGGGVALASGGPGASAATTATTATASSGGVAAASSATKDPARRFARRHPRIVLAGFRAAAADLGLTPKELRAQLRDGKSLAQVASTRGKSVSGLENAILAATSKVIDAHANWTAAQQAKVISEIKTHLNAIVNAQYPFGIGKQAPTAASGSAAATA